MSEHELYHYGVKGMKWGVRRYRKDPGSYTRKGLANFDSSSDKYDAAKRKLEESKLAGDKNQIKSNRRALKSAKTRLKKDYKQLKMDKLADQGKSLYQRGKTISGGLTTNARIQASVVLGSAVAMKLLRNSGNVRLAYIASRTIATGGTAVNAILAAKTYSDNRKLRAYYGHSRVYRG